MILTHVWLCGRWVWRKLTFQQWAALPHISKELALIKAAKIAGALVCTAPIGLVLPPLVDHGGFVPHWAVLSRGRAAIARSPVWQAIPEPWPLAVFGIGLVGLVFVRKRNVTKD